MEIVPSTTEYAQSLDVAVNAVAAENLYLSIDRGFGKEETERFIRDCIKHKYPQFLLVEADTVFGWCDIVADDTYGHGRLGIGVCREARGMGWGERLIRIALQAGFRRFRVIELCVRADNARAIGLYEKVGFTVYNRRKPMRIAGFYGGRRLHMHLKRRTYRRLQACSL